MGHVAYPLTDTTQRIQQTGTSIFQYVENILESAVASIVRVGHMVYYLQPTIVRHAYDFLFFLQSGCQRLLLTDVTVVHSYNPIEIKEIIIPHRT